MEDSSLWRMARFAKAMAMTLALAACASRTAWEPMHYADQEVDVSYIDLLPGWRVRVVTPLLKSGGYQLADLTATSNADLSITLSSRDSEDFIGYETAYYSVQRDGDGVRVEFGSAETSIDATRSSRPRPTVPLFLIPESSKYVRLVYLVRQSVSDHNMAIVAADRKDLLEDLTKQVREAPEGCHTVGSGYCSWVPLGIAVRPEAHSNARDNERGSEE
jgi:hypothetical protein